MTIYEKQLAQIIDSRYGDLPTRNLLEKLMEMGVVDYTRCKILAVRNVVDEMVKKRNKKKRRNVVRIRTVRVFLRIHPQMRILLY